MDGLPIAFTSPWMLVALAVLPALWWLLRVVPPRPREVPFPPLRLLLDAIRPRETPARTPWWLILMRMALAVLVILALAGPVWRPAAVTGTGSGPLLLLVDNGWAAAPAWELRARVIEERINGAATQSRPVALVALADAPGDIDLVSASAALDRLRVLQPRPHAPRLEAHTAFVGAFLHTHADASAVWYSDGIEHGEGRAFAEMLAASATAPVIHLDREAAPRGLTDARNRAASLSVTVLRPDTVHGASGSVRAVDPRGRTVGEAPFAFAADARTTQAELDLPLELRNAVNRLEIAGEASAGAVRLLDGSSRRRTVGLIDAATAETAQPLLSPSYYLTRALDPFADVVTLRGQGTAQAIRDLVEQRVSLIILAGVGTVPDEARAALQGWIEGGGVLLRFAGGRIAEASEDFTPVRLRQGDRSLGGALSWETPQPLGSFNPEGPLAGLAVPDDVEVTRQILAEPDIDLPARTWAALADGTPLVTGRMEGDGYVALVHVTADTTWSSLPLSGAFVAMLQRLVELSPTPSADAAATGDAAAARRDLLAPQRILDGFGAFAAPHATARPIPASGLAAATPDHPPGFYGAADSPVAVNTLPDGATLTALDLQSLNVAVADYARAPETRLAPVLIALGAGILLLDTVVVLLFAGALSLRRGAPAAMMIALGLLGLPDPARAQVADDDFAMRASLETRLAYVITGDKAVDETSRAGLEGLSIQLALRTAFEAGDPVGVDPERNDLSFFPLLYWPVTPDAPRPGAEALARIDAYMKQGGIILFDTRDALYNRGSIASGPAGQALRAMLASLDVPELEPVSPAHVLTKTFYLLQDFPGRYDDGDLWAEAMPFEDEDLSNRPARSGDGVSPILITSNDLAAAWAVTPDGRAMFPTASPHPRQREMAYRAGINIVIYALTGNYKADQVHVPALLERLGQ